MSERALNKEVFFGLVRLQGTDPYANIYGFNAPEYEIYFINDSDKAVTLKGKGYGGFKTDEDVVTMATPKEEAVNIVVKPHGYVLYCFVSEWAFEGANQYQADIETGGVAMALTFYLSGGVGFMGSLIPCLNKYGRVICPQIKILD